MTGELYINGIDVYREFGITPMRGTFNEVMKPVTVKSPLAVELENEHGEVTLFPNNMALLDARDFTIPLAIVAYNSNDFFDKKARFESMLQSGTFLMFFPKINLAMTCYLKEVTQYTQLEPIQVNAGKRVSAVINLSLREPNPSRRGLNKEEHSYGVIIDENQPNPDLQRIGNEDMAKNAVVNELAVQGTLDQYGYLKRFNKTNGLLYADGSPSIIDGSAGNVMTHMPPFYYLVEDVSATVHKLWVSPYPIPGFYVHPGFTTGSFKAAASNSPIFGRPANTLWSVANSNIEFRGGNNDPTNDALEKGFLGKARTVLSRTNFRAFAQNQGPDYGLIDYNTHVALFMLFVTKYATLNSQKSVGDKVNGYFAGGLGAGLTNVSGTDWANYNGYYPLVKCGLTLQMGLIDGETDCVIPNFNAGGNLTVKINNFMGIENPFGDLWEWTQGINIWKQTEAEGNKFLAYIYNNNIYEDSITTKYSRIFEFGKTGDGWLRKIVMGKYFDTLGVEIGNGASSSTYYTDYFYNALATGYRGLLRGGHANKGADAGLAYANTNYAVSDASANIGSRLGYYGRVRPGL
jgi:hypothetical protein